MITENGHFHDDILQRFEDEFSNFVSEFHNSVNINLVMLRRNTVGSNGFVLSAGRCEKSKEEN